MAPIDPPKTLKDLLQWQPLFDNSFLPELPKSYNGLPNRRRTLVCHDYKGGYGKDNSVLPVCFDNDYLFLHWPLCDVFVYFSHHLVTIPPDGWVCAAHRNATPLLGTFITEGTEGSAMCNEFLQDEVLGKQVADQLVQIALHHKLQGWLINIESDVHEKCVQPLIAWLKYLRQKVHDEVQHGMVIWYDSIVMSGSVQHQNELNANNLAFYQASDAIFLNYWWTEGELKNSLETASNLLDESETVDSLQMRNEYSIYVGVDVFGRKTFGGGEFSCNAAVSVCCCLDMSVAIFAPGWTHENASSIEFQDPDAFPKRDVKFWNLLAPLLPKPEPTPIDIPFSSSFCNGIDFTDVVERESDVDTGIVETLKDRMMYSLINTATAPHCGPLFSYYLQHIAKIHQWDMTNFNVAIPVEIFQSSSDWIKLLHVSFTPRDSLKILLKYRFAFRNDIAKYVPENIRATFVMYFSQNGSLQAMDVKYGPLDWTSNHCVVEYEIEDGREISAVMVVLGNLESTEASNFLPSSESGRKSSRNGSMKPVLLLNDCDIYCTLESSSCMIIIDKVEIREKSKQEKTSK